MKLYAAKLGGFYDWELNAFLAAERVYLTDTQRTKKFDHSLRYAKSFCFPSIWQKYNFEEYRQMG